MIRYLYGPGKKNEHTDPHLIAGFRHAAALEPSVRPSGRRDLGGLSRVLNHPLEALQGISFDQAVWECSMRAAPTDHLLTDDEWADVAEEVMHRTGIAARGDPSGCRWIAVRHADDHIHIVATLAREDGRRPRLWHDHLRVREVCHAVEERYGLRRTAPADRTANPRPSRAETEMAQREGWDVLPRTKLRRQVSAATASANSPDEFFALLDDAGLLINRRLSVRNPGEVTGYAVALPDHTDRSGKPVWFSGKKLAPSLTWPKVSARWSAGPSAPSGSSGPVRPAIAHNPRMRSSGPGPTFAQRTAAYQQAARAATTAAQQMRWLNDPAAIADLASATADLLRVAAHITGNQQLTEAADSYDRAAREPYGRQAPITPQGDALRTTARLLALTHICDMRGRAVRLTFELLILIANIATLCEAVAIFRAAQRRPVQAQAADYAARQLHDLQRASPRLPAPAIPTPQLSPTQLAAAAFPAPPLSGRPGSSPPSDASPRTNSDLSRPRGPHR